MVGTAGMLLGDHARAVETCDASRRENLLTLHPLGGRCTALRALLVYPLNRDELRDAERSVALHCFRGLPVGKEMKC